jgi:hypothetical protein
VTFEVSQRARILADLLERRRILAEAKSLRHRLRVLTAQRRAFAAQVIALRYRAKLRQVNAIAASICWEPDHIDEK